MFLFFLLRTLVVFHCGRNCKALIHQPVFVSVIMFMKVFNLIFGFQLMVTRCGRGFAQSNVGL